MITKKNRPKRIWVDKGTEIYEALKNFCAAVGIQVYSIMSETKAAFAERTIRSLKNILYRYMEDFGYKYIDKLPLFITTLNTRRSSSIDMRPNTVKNCDFLSILHSKALQEYKKPVFKTGDIVRIAKFDLPFRKGYKPQFKREVFEVLAFATKKPPTYTIKDEQGEIIQGKFYQANPKMEHPSEIKSETPCEKEYKKYCLTGGKCFYLDDEDVVGCNLTWL